MRYHEIVITFMRTTRVPPSGVDFAHTVNEFVLLEETGKPQMPFFLVAQNAFGLKHKIAHCRMIPDAFLREK